MLLNGRVVDFVSICSGQNWLKPMKMTGHFRNWNMRQMDFKSNMSDADPTFISILIIILKHGI